MTLYDGEKISTTVIAFLPPPTVATLDTAIAKQKNVVVEITNDELAAADYGQPCNGDRLTDGPKHYTLTDASPVFDRETLCGWVLIAAGGE